jgi:hypothetical protein
MSICDMTYQDTHRRGHLAVFPQDQEWLSYDWYRVGIFKKCLQISDCLLVKLFLFIQGTCHVVPLQILPVDKSQLVETRPSTRNLTPREILQSIADS